MRITKNFSVKLSHTPNKQNLIRLAHLLIETTKNTFEEVYFSFDDRGASISCCGNEFSKNFFDEDYAHVYISSDWNAHRGHISISVYPEDECRVTIAANHLSRPEVNDLANELTEKIISVLQKEPQQCGSDDHSQANTIYTNHDKWYNSNWFWGIISVLGVIAGIVVAIVIK